MARIQLDFTAKTSKLACDRCREEFTATLNEGLKLEHYCFECRKKDIPRYKKRMKDAEREGFKERMKFLEQTWQGLSKYDMESTGSDQVDEAVREVYGDNKKYD